MMSKHDLTDFPTKGEDKKISLRNSNYPQFDYDFIAGVKENDNDIYKAGGNIRGNEAFNLWTKARNGEETAGVLSWIKEREAWVARHFEDGSQFKSGDKKARPSNIAGVIAQMKWGVIGTLGEQRMKDVVLEAIKYREGKESGSASQAQQDRQVSDAVEKGLREKVKEHNEEVNNAASKRTTYRVLLAVFERGIGAYKTNPASVRPNVGSAEQWAYARVNSFLFALRNGRFQGGKHDQDLLPERHPLSTKNKEEKIMDIEKEDRHILNVSETDNSVIVEFKKVEDDSEEMEMEMTEDERPYHDDEDKDKDRNVIDEKIEYRTVTLSRSHHIDEEKRTVRMGVSSEEPVERSFGKEVLSHKAEDINMSFIQSKTAPLLLDHDMTKQIGVIEEFRLDEKQKRTTALVRFGKSNLAREVFQDVVDGIRMNVSLGYRIDKMERTEKDDETYYRAAFTPMEVSMVSIPADQSRLVGVGRSKDKQTISYNEVREMENEKQEINLDEVKSNAVVEAKAEFKRNSKEILDLAARHKTSEIGLTEKETKRFSILRAINAMANPTDRKAQEEAAFEFECSRAAGELYGKTAQGVLLPPEVLSNWSQRDLNASDDSNLIGQDFRAGDFIDVLRNSSAVMQNATILNGLSGDVKIPKKTAAATAAFISSEGGAAGESEMTIGSVTMSPKTLGAFTDVTRQLMIQSSLDVENLIRSDLAGSMAIAIDNAALEGSGSSGNPTGITNTTGINTVSLSSAAAPTFAEMVSMESAVAVDNALLGGLVYIVHPTNAGTLKTTTKDSGSGQFVYQNGEINGYPVVVSSQLTANNYVFGNMQDLLVGMFSGLDIVVDPYSNSTSGTVRVVALQSLDVNVRHAVSFCAAS
jgi:HK97 family phage major capsid protein